MSTKTIPNHKLLDKLVRCHTAFNSFLQLLRAEGGYRPSLYGGQFCKTEREAREIHALAYGYDRAQRLRRDSRRAFRCGF